MPAQNPNRELLGAKGPHDQDRLSRVRCANAYLSGALANISEALAGRGNFGVAELRAVADRVADVAPFVPAAIAELPGSSPLQDELQVYARNLRALQVPLDRLRCMLLARCAAIRGRQNHLRSVERWSAAWQQTR